jgi:peptide deformylase
MEIVVPEAFKPLFEQSDDRPIVKVPADVLRAKAAPVAKVTARHKHLAENMVKIMKQARGIGLAAPQVGVSEQLIVIAPEGSAMILYNPEVLEEEGAAMGEEGCLSIPGLYGDVERPEKIKVKALNRKGRDVELVLEGIDARVALHEIDHLNGVLFIDKVDESTLHWRHPDDQDED